jgi:hypothetical protein
VAAPRECERSRSADAAARPGDECTPIAHYS